MSVLSKLREEANGMEVKIGKDSQFVCRLPLVSPTKEQRREKIMCLPKGATNETS